MSFDQKNALSKANVDDDSTSDIGLEDIWGSQEKVICGVAVDKNTVTCVQLSVTFTILLIFGGGVFYAIEHPNEIKRINLARANYFADQQEVINLLFNTNSAGSMNKTLALYEELQQHSLGFQMGPDDKNQWVFNKAVIFSFTIITTIGYGTFAPATISGQMFLIFYALIGIPIAGLSLGFIAERALYVFTLVSQVGKDKALEAFKEFDDDGSGELDEDEFKDAIKMLGFSLTPVEFKKLWSEVDQDGGGTVDLDEFRDAIKFMRADVTEAAGQKNKVYITVIGIILWVAIGVMMFSVMEGWRADKSLYFVFVSLTTIGLGDFFPESSLGLAFLVVFAMVGLGLVAVLLTLVESIFAEVDNSRKRKEEEKKYHQEYKKKLKSIPLFADLSDEQLSDLAEKVKSIEYGPNINFIKEGANLDSMFVLINGSVSISKPGSGVTETITERCLLLESTILSCNTIKQSEVIVSTLEDVELLTFNRNDWEPPKDGSQSMVESNDTQPYLNDLRIHVESFHRDTQWRSNEFPNKNVGGFTNFSIKDNNFESEQIEIILP